VQSRVFNFAVTLWLVLACALSFAPRSGAQIRLGGVAESNPQSSVHAQDLIQTRLSLNLCVDGSATYPCPNPVLSDNVYIPAITLTYGQILDGVVTYGAVGGPDPTSGTITILKGMQAVCVLVIGVDHACPPNSTIFDVGNYTLSATFTFPAGSAYANFDTNAGPCATTPTCDVTIAIAKDTSSIALKSSANPAALGTAVTITAIVTGGFPAIPTGDVIFTLDDGTLPAVALDATGAASFTTSTLSLGMHTITAFYGGATDFLPASEAATFKQQIVPPATVTTIASSLNPSNAGDKVTFTSTVATTSVLGAAPTGAVTFKDGTASFATVLVSAKGAQNVAQATISTLGAGTHSITAIYSGDSATSASVSPVLVQQVDYPLTMPPPGYTIRVTPVPVVLGTGQTAHLTVTVTPVSGFAGAVTLSCSNLPNESACTFGEATIPAGGGTTTLALSTMAPHDCGSNVPYGGFGAALQPLSLGFGKIVAFGGPALAGVLLLLPRKRGSSSQMRCLLVLAMVCALAGLSGCGGNCTDFGTSPGSYSFKVNGAVPNATPVTTGGAPTAGGTATPNVTTSVALTVKP
jgi:hypothetical protein